VSPKTDFLDLSNVEYIIVYDEIPFSGIGYCLVRSCPVHLRAPLFEYAAYKLSGKGASKIMLGVVEKLGFFSYYKNFAPLKVNHLYDMLLMRRKVPLRPTFSHELKLQPITSEEIEDYWLMHNEIFNGIDNASFSRRKDIEICFHKNNYEIMFVKHKNAVIGICEFELLGSTAIIDTIGIKAQYRGYGFGKYLLDNVLYILRSEGIRISELVVSSSNKKALGLYISQGFKKTETLSKWYEIVI
jgi:ribosomal protein S18 acetylase RimI-like enzyme